MKKIFEIIYYFFLAFVVLISLLLIFSVFPIKGNYKIFIVQSGSMQPKIKMGSIVIVKPERDYKIGEIITFGSYGKRNAPTTHRIYDIKVVNSQPVYITKGDANDTPDQREVRKNQIIGKVLFSIPYLGFILAFAKKPLGFFLIIIIPAVIIIIDEIKNIYQEIKKRKYGF